MFAENFNYDIHMYWHIETDFVCLGIMIALYYNMNKIDVVKDKQGRMFKTIAGVSVSSIAIDILASVAMDYATNWWVYQLLNMLYFITVPLLILLWYYYVRISIFPVPSEKQSLVTRICSIPYVLYVLICLSNPFTGWIFSLSKDMVYARGPLFAASIILLLFYTVVCIITIIINRKRIVPRSRIGLFLLFFIVVILGVYLQLANPGWLVIYGSFTMIFVITYFYIQNRRTMIDNLTGLLTRYSGVQQITDFLEENSDVEHTGADENKGVLILTDLDNFKLVNDSAGHRAGDLVLRCAAETCQEVFAKNAIIGRLGGDEFIIFLSYPVSREELGQLLRKLNTDFVEKLASDKENQDIPPVTFSMGAAFFPEHGLNFP